MIRDAARLSRHDGPWYYEIQSLGFNYRLSAIQCALGRSQLRKLERFSARRRAIVERYRQAFADEPRLRRQQQRAEAEPAWHLFTVQVEKRAALFAALQRRGIAPQVHYTAVNDMPLYRSLGHSPSETPLAARASQQLLSLPLYPGLTDAEVDQVIFAVHQSLAEVG
jgi:perosamine synthetase